MGYELMVFCIPLQKYCQLNKSNHGNGNVRCELDLYPILRIPGALSIVLWFSCDLEGSFKAGKTEVVLPLKILQSYNDRR